MRGFLKLDGVQLFVDNNAVLHFCRERAALSCHETYYKEGFGAFKSGLVADVDKCGIEGFDTIGVKPVVCEVFHLLHWQPAQCLQTATSAGRKA